MSTTALHGQTPFPLTVRDEACGFEGNSDLYGLGIRLGIYMQWLSTFLTDLHSLKFLWEVNSAFIFAIFTAILVLTREPRPTHTAEMSVLTYMIFGGVYMMLPANLRMLKATSSDGGILLDHYIGLNFLSGIVACYFIWFWIGGIHSDNFLATPCGSYGFLFAKVSLSNRHVTNTFAAASAIYAAMMITIAVLRSATRRQLRADEPASPQPDTTGEERQRGQELGRRSPPRFSLLLWCFKISYLSYTVLGIELTLYWNGVTDVYSVSMVGQLIPLTIGGYGLWSVIHARGMEKFGVLKKATRQEHSQQQGDAEAGVIAPS